ncbi:hypothetical protein [Microcella sp.]|uniref:hypothetical protein n=1 Tax=Microcella sp. TaxID=1913979 RepID=UPI0025624358|nr:hypothetical protein [Microcella sp.]MBX9472083.1 hypothetical protein [Microcella sp.]
MSPTRHGARLASATAALAILAIAVGAGAASASHFRASGPDLSVTGDVATWELTSAWATNSHGTFVAEEEYDDDLGDYTGEWVGETEVKAISSYSDIPGAGAGTGVTLSITSVIETDEPLFAQVVETMSGSLAGLPDGLYELYAEGCCRVGDIENSATSDFSQWVRFSKTGSTYAVAPRLTSPIIYAPLALDGTTTMVSYAAPGATTWTVVESADGPYYGSQTLPCSTFVGAALEIGAEHCTGGDVYTDIYLTGTFWAFKTTIADAAGRQSVAETLFRVESIPEPYIDEHAWLDGGGTAVFSAYAEDVVVNSWRVTCTNTADSTDVLTATSPTSPISVSGFIGEQQYDCVVAATNGAGTGTTTQGDYVVTAPDIELALEFGAGDLYAGSSALVSGAGLDEESDYTLTMYSDPLELLSGVTDLDGAFSEDVVIPEDACITGEHELRLIGQSDNASVSASQYVEIDAECMVVRVSSTPFGAPELAETGSAPTALAVGIGTTTLALGAALLLGAGLLRRASRRTV